MTYVVEVQRGGGHFWTDCVCATARGAIERATYVLRSRAAGGFLWLGGVRVRSIAPDGTGRVLWADGRDGKRLS